MTRWIYVRPTDKFTGLSFHLSVTGDSAGAVPGRVVENLEQLELTFERAGLRKLLGQVFLSVSHGQTYISGPLDLTPEQERILMSREREPRFADAVNAVLAELQKRGTINDDCFRCGANDWDADLVRLHA